MAIELGQAFVQIVPSARGISGEIKNVLDPEARSAGQSAGDTIGSQIASFATKAIAALGVGKMISDAITDGMDFEKSMAKTSTLFSGTKEELAGFEKELLGISNATGVAVSELAEAAYSAESASVPMGNLGGMIKASSELATAGFTDIDTALSATAKTMNAYGMMSDDVAETQANMEKVQRILIQTQNKGITTVGELGASLAQVTPTAAAFGVSFEQVGASLAGMTAQGTPTAQATTQLNALIAELGKNGTQAAKNLEAAAEGTEFAGMSFVEMMEHGADLNGVLLMMQQQAEADGVSMVDMFSSIEAGKAALSITNSDWLGNMEAMATEADVVGEAYSTMTDTVGFKSEQLKNSLKNIGIEVFNASADVLMAALDGIAAGFEIIKPSLEAVGTAFGTLIDTIANYIAEQAGITEDFNLFEAAAQVVADVLQALADAINFVSDNMEIIAPIVATVVAAFVAFETVSFVVGFIQGLSGAFTALSAALTLNPIGLIVAGLAALAAALVYFYNTNDQFRQKVNDIIGKIKEAFGDFVENVKTWLDQIIQWVTPVVESIRGYLSAMVELVQTVISTIGNAISNFITTHKTQIDMFITTMKTVFKIGFDAIKIVVTTVFENIKTVITTVLNVITNLVKAFTSALKGDWSGALNYLKSAAQSALNGVKQLFENLKSGLQGIFNSIMSNMKSWGRDMIDSLVGGIREKISAVKDAVGSVADTVKSYLHFSEPDVGPLSDFHTYMPDMIKMLTGGIEKGIPEVQKAMDALSYNLIPGYAAADSEVRGTSNSNVVINVYGAEGQDINALAEVIQNKINNAVSQREHVYA